MRSEFRFPKATATLMTIILAAVVMAIEKATAIQNSILPSSPPVGPTQPAHFTFLPTLLLILSLACLVAFWDGSFFSPCTVQERSGWRTLIPPASGHPAACASKQAIVRAFVSRAVA